MELIVIAGLAIVVFLALQHARRLKKRGEETERQAALDAADRDYERRVASQRRPEHRPMSLPDRAAAPRAPAIAHSSASDGLIIEYADAYGVVTDREIRDARVETFDGTVYLDAFCTLRRERRTFRVDRVQRLWKADGTAVLDPGAFFGERTRGSRPVRVVDIPPDHKRAMARVKPLLDALIWIARADREVDADEMHILFDFIDARLAIGRAKDTPEWDKHLAGATIDDATPIKAGAVKALLRVAQDSDQARIFREAAERLVGSDPGKANRYAQLLKAWG